MLVHNLFLVLVPVLVREHPSFSLQFSFSFTILTLVLYHNVMRDEWHVCVCAEHVRRNIGRHTSWSVRNVVTRSAAHSWWVFRSRRPPTATCVSCSMTTPGMWHITAELLAGIQSVLWGSWCLDCRKKQESWERGEDNFYTALRILVHF